MPRPGYKRVWWSQYELPIETERPKLPRRVSDYYQPNGRFWPYPGWVKESYYFGPLFRYHEKVAKLALTLEDDNYRIPAGVRYAMKLQMTWNQIAGRYPWAVYVVLRRNKRVRIKRSTIASAVALHKRLIRRYPTATIVSLRRSYDVPPQWRGRIPPPWKWCPRCLKPRKFKRVYHESGDPQTFYALVKTWSEEKGRWESKERKLALMRCPMCHITNRDFVFRRSNQPIHIRRLRPGARASAAPNPARRKQVDETMYLMKPKRKRGRKRKKGK